MWQKLATIAQGGSVFSIHTNQANQTWLATGAGILHQTQQGWEPIEQSQPLPTMMALCSAPAGQMWWAAGLTGNLARTKNSGQSWELCWLDQIVEPVVCFAVSPRYNTDYTVLAGTNGAGVLRSTDGGRRWFVSNFGLQDFTILALATATDWSRREVVFAGTLAGVYRSSGGGRAWKAAGLQNVTIQALATSAHFSENGLILAGTEGEGIYRSVDGGKNWQPANRGLTAGCSVNTLLRYPAGNREVWLAGTDDSRLWQSVDGGQSWRQLLTTDNPVLSLAYGAGTLLAGLSDSGLLISNDGGESWSASQPLFGRGWQRLTPGSSGLLLALAPNDGVWASADGGQSWSRELAASLDNPLFALTVAGQTWLAARLNGLWRREGQQAWQQVFTVSGAPIAALAAGNAGPIWAAATDGRLWQSLDSGQSWQPVATPFAGQQLLALAATPEDSLPLVGVLNPQNSQLTLWRSLDTGEEWEPWLRQPVAQPFAQVVAGPEDGPHWLVANNEIWRHAAGAWQKVGEFEQTVRRAAASASGEWLYVLVGGKLLCNNADDTWTPLDLPGQAKTPVDVHVTNTGNLLALDITGTLWQMG